MEDLLQIGMIEACTAQDGVVDVVQGDVVGPSPLDHPGDILHRALARLFLSILAAQTRHKDLFIDFRDVHVVESISTSVNTFDDAEAIECSDGQFDHNHADVVVVAGLDVGRGTAGPGLGAAEVAEAPAGYGCRQGRSHDSVGVEWVVVGGEPADEIRCGHHRAESSVLEGTLHFPS